LLSREPGGSIALVRKLSPGRFDAAALYAALDAQRRERNLTWAQAGLQIGVSPSTLTRTRLGGRMEVDGMLAMVRWLGRTAESFTVGYDANLPQSGEFDPSRSPSYDEKAAPAPLAEARRRSSDG
jgi:hypothetical protein